MEAFLAYAALTGAVTAGVGLGLQHSKLKGFGGSLVVLALAGMLALPI